MNVIQSKPSGEMKRTGAHRRGDIWEGNSFFLIDVDRTGAVCPYPPLRSGKHKYGFHGKAADPPHLHLRPALTPPCWEILIEKRRYPNVEPLHRNRPR